MVPPNNFFSLSRFAAVLVLAQPFCGFLEAQVGDGFTVQQRPGIALIKAQAWSKPQESSPMEFLAFTDRTASGGQAGYYEFKTKQVEKRQVAANKVAKLVVYSDPKSFVDVASTAEREKIVAAVRELQASVAEFPSLKTYLEPSVKALNAEIAQYDSGKLKVKGEWVSKDIFYAERTTSLGNQLRTDISHAVAAQQFDLASDPRFVGLQQIATSSPTAAKLVAELTELHGKRVRDEQRQALITQLSAPTISMTEAEGGVARLKALQPDEDVKAAAFLKKWQSGLAVVNSSNETAKPLAAALESELGAIPQPVEPPVLSADLAEKIATLNGDVAPFLATKPVPVLVTEDRLPIAICKVAEGFKKLQPLFEGKQFLQAQDVIGPLASSGHDVGPETVRVITALQKLAVQKTEQFTKLREEAKLLQSNGKQADALAKLTAAYAVLADKAVGEQIESLKKTLPAP